jgi:uncharacterized NAD-dependent epimerase/dehydratase family protein
LGEFIQDFCKGTQIADERLNGLFHDVKSLEKALESMKETLEDDTVRTEFQSAGHIGNHWKNIASCIEDGGSTLTKLHSKLEKVNKSTSSAAKHVRLKMAWDEIGMHQYQIRSYVDTIMLSIQAVVL